MLGRTHQHSHRFRETGVKHLNVTDFGKNTFQCEIGFRFDCLSPDFFVVVAHFFASKTEPAWLFGRDEQTSLLLTTGDGSEQHPFFQIKFGPNKLILWAGWHVSHDLWKAWRAGAIEDLNALSNNFPALFMSEIVTQAVIVVPSERLKPSLDDNPHLKPVVDYYRQFIPEEYLGRGGGHTLFATVDASRVLETQVVGNPATRENTYTFRHRWTAVNPQLTIGQNVLGHLTVFDELFEKYHDSVVLPLIINR